jgi:hypothetical protein
MSPAPKTKRSAARIAVLERQLKEALAGQAHTCHFATEALKTVTTAHLAGSGVVLTMTVLGGREVISPTLIRDGLSDQLIAALKADLLRSYELAVMFKPKGPA